MPKNLNVISGSRIGGTGTPGSKRVKKVAGGAVTKGDVIAKGTAGDVDKWLRASTTSTGPFAVAVEDELAATTSLSMVDDGEINVVADGAIDPNSYVMRASATAGQVIAFSGTDESLIVGRYLRHEGEDSADQTAAADGDIIVIRLGLAQGVNPT